MEIQIGKWKVSQIPKEKLTFCILSADFPNAVILVEGFTRSTREEIPADDALKNWRLAGALRHEIFHNSLQISQLSTTKEEKKWDLRYLTCPPTTATEGRASQREPPSPPPWSPRTVQALCILLTRPIKLSIVAIDLGSIIRERFRSD